MDNSYIIFSNTIMRKVREICVNNNLWYRDSDMGVSVLQIDTGMRIWWLTMHHKINQKGVLKMLERGHVPTKNDLGQAKTTTRTILAAANKITGTYSYEPHPEYPTANDKFFFRTGIKIEIPPIKFDPPSIC